MIALVALLVGAGLGYAFGRATTSSPAYDQAGKTRPGQMAPGAGPWYHFPQGQGDDHGRMGPGRGGNGQGGNGQGGTDQSGNGQGGNGQGGNDQSG